MTCGIITGCDKNQEWLLPWWWEIYSRHNTYPVAFADFGMSSRAKRWCQRRGEILTVQMKDLSTKKNTDPAVVDILEGFSLKKIWKMRSSWFKRPLAMLQSPFDKSLWLDLDCEVLSSLDAIFKEPLPESGLGMAKAMYLAPSAVERGCLYPEESMFNSSVALFEKGSPLLAQWVAEIVKNSKGFIADDFVVSRLIYKNQIKIKELPQEYNWVVKFGFHSKVSIVHWVGEGKEFIRYFGGISKILPKEIHDKI